MKSCNKDNTVFSKFVFSAQAGESYIAATCEVFAFCSLNFSELLSKPLCCSVENVSFVLQLRIIEMEVCNKLFL